MRTEEELRERFDRAVDGLRPPGGDLSRVASRARQRARRQRVAGAAAGVAAVLVAVVLVPRLVPPPEGFTVDPVATPTEAVPSGAETTEPAPQAPDEPFDEEHIRYGIDGVVRADGTLLSSLKTQRAFGLAGGGAVVQSGTGAPIVRVDPDGTEHRLLQSTESLRLLTVHLGEVWATARRPSDGGEDEEHLWSVPLDGGEPVDHGFSAGVESFTDALAFLPSGGAAWLGCHLQCSIIVGDAHPAVPDQRDRITDRAGWFAGLAVSPSGDRLALVEGPDPVIGGASDVVVLDLAGRELARVPLGAAVALDTARVEFTADGADLVAGDETSAFVVRSWSADEPTVTRLEGAAGVALLPAQAVSPDAAADVVQDFAERGIGWTGATVGAPRVEDGRTWMPLGVDDDRPPTDVMVEDLAGELTVTGGGDLAADHEDTSGWWFGVSAEDGRIAFSGHAPTWADGEVAASVWSPGDGGGPATTMGQRGEDGAFSVELDVPEQATHDVVVLLTTLEADVATSFALVRIPAGRFAAS